MADDKPWKTVTVPSDWTNEDAPGSERAMGDPSGVRMGDGLTQLADELDTSVERRRSSASLNAFGADEETETTPSTRSPAGIGTPR